MERRADQAVSQEVKKTKIITALVPSFILVDCDRTPSAATDQPPAGVGQPGSQEPFDAGFTVGSDPADSSRLIKVNDGRPYLAPPVLTPSAERSATGACSALLSFARAIESGELERARTSLSAADRLKWSKKQFRAIFANLDFVTVAVPSGSVECKSAFAGYIAPITVTGIDPDGHAVRIEGEALLKSINKFDRSSAVRISWCFDRLKLDIAH